MSGLGQAMWRQAGRDLSHARASLERGDHEWAVFAAQQAAEKALKAVLLSAGQPAPAIHALDRLFERLIAHGLASEQDAAPLREAMSTLVQGWAMARYPIPGLDTAPADLITREQAEAAIRHAEAILAFAGTRGLPPP